MASEITHLTRTAAGEPEGALVLFHGRGADERDLYPLFDLFDPDQRLLGLSPRGPLALPPGGAHWYVVRQVGYPDPDTFHPTFEAASGWLDAAIDESGIPWDRVVLGGFSQGAVMTYSLGLGKGRPRPAGLMPLSGFIPTVDRFEADLGRAKNLPVAITHGSLDPVIAVGWSRQARDLLEAAGAQVLYREPPIGHGIDPSLIPELRAWLDEVLLVPRS